MFRSALDNVRPGMVLAADVTDEAGRVLLRRGVPLTNSFIHALQRSGHLSVFIEDGLADDIPRRDIISSSLRRSTATHLSTVFNGAVMAARLDEDDKPVSVDDAIERLGGNEIGVDEGWRAAVDKLFDDVERLLNEVLDPDTEASLETLKTHNDYTYQHSVDVAAVGTLLGQRAGLDREELRELALGCLVHDIGKVYIDNAILDKPGKLTPQEFEEIKKHPRMGFELVRRMPLASILPAHVSYQHHERQDGRGYPRNLTGSNHIIRASAEKLDGRRMLLIAEIAAVADVYSALTSDRSYREALRHDVAADMIAGMAGSHLNRDVVRLFERTFPRFPVGHWVEVTTGPQTGWRGVVVSTHPAAPDRPLVRLLSDDRGEPLANPAEIDTRVADRLGMALVDAPRRVGAVLVPAGH
jgi:HD-GYP domain-containing protein (c-di-GMP phosphodiesterase class II)